MAEWRVVNASLIILLAKAGFLELLRVGAQHVVIPRAVADEIHQRGPDDVTVRALTEASWIGVVDIGSIANDIQLWDLGPGESAVLSWAMGHPGAEAVVDDGEERRCATALAIPLRGTLGLVLLAKQRGLITL